MDYVLIINGNFNHWDGISGPIWGETDNEVVERVAAASGKKQKRTGTRVTDCSQDEFKPVDPRSNVTQTERPRTRDRKVEPKSETSMDVTAGVANRAVADRMLELFKLYTVCITEAEGVTAVVQKELDDRAKSHGISRSMVSKMTEQMSEIWTNTAEA